MFKFNKKRIFDCLVSLFLLIFFLPILILIAFSVRVTSKGPILYWSKRIGQDEEIFSMPKFRTMYIGTEEMASHLLVNPAEKITLVGSLLRKFSLDELPQLWSVFIGKMSLIGPRPALFNQDDLILRRRKYSIHDDLPGITGWSQVKGRDLNSIEKKVQLEFEYKQIRSIKVDLNILLLTLIKVIRFNDISH